MSSSRIVLEASSILCLLLLAWVLAREGAEPGDRMIQLPLESGKTRPLEVTLERKPD